VTLTENDFATEQGVSWYVSRRIEVAASDLPVVQLPSAVTGADGTSLAILGPIFVDDDRYRSFDAVLSFPGMLSGKLRVEIDLNPYSSSFGEVGMRPARRVPRLLVSADRYFDGAWSVLDALAAEIATVHDVPVTSESAVRAGRAA